MNVSVEFHGEELAKAMEGIKATIRDLEDQTAFLMCKAPKLVAVPGNDNGYIKIGDISVYGIEALSKEQNQSLISLLSSFADKS